MTARSHTRLRRKAKKRARRTRVSPITRPAKVKSVGGR
jgi:hypothetical protein